MGIRNASIEELIITRGILFPDPLTTDRIRLNVVEGDFPAVVKMDFFGTTPDKSYSVDPVFEKKIYQNGMNRCIYCKNALEICKIILSKILKYDVVLTCILRKN